MTNKDIDFWITNIENLADTVENKYGHQVVTFIFKKYGSDCIEDLTVSELSLIFNELYALTTL